MLDYSNLVYTKDGRWFNMFTENKKLKKILYYFLAFICIGIDLTLLINYSFFMLNAFIGKYLLFYEKRLSEIPPLEYFLGIIIFPIVLGTILKYLH